VISPEDSIGSACERLRIAVAEFLEEGPQGRSFGALLDYGAAAYRNRIWWRGIRHRASRSQWWWFSRCREERSVGS